MALFQRVPGGPGSEFGSLFRLLDDYDAHRADKQLQPGRLSSFAPKFDVREHKDSYVLDGELPGIDQNNIEIEFTDPHTLIVKGRAEREYQSGTPPATATRGAIEGASGGSSNKFQPRVEEEGAASAASTSQEQHQKKRKHGAGGQAQEETKYWISERSVGEFQRSFNFPTRVDQDGVRASLKKGVLNITVPKATAPTTKRITIE